LKELNFDDVVLTTLFYSHGLNVCLTLLNNYRFCTERAHE